jgi:hypothetical protein
MIHLRIFIKGTNIALYTNNYVTEYKLIVVISVEQGREILCFFIQEAFSKLAKINNIVF